MKTHNKGIEVVPLVITYLLVKIIHYLIGFDYNLLEEGVLTLKFVLDVVSWGLVYGLTYFMVQKIRTPKQV